MKSSARDQLLRQVVKSGLCCGCGVCAGVCPNGSIQMRMNTVGEYEPVPGPAACQHCRRCLQVCPFVPGHQDRRALCAGRWHSAHDSQPWSNVTGFFHAAYAGHVRNEAARMRSASGGLATWFLQRLLRTGTVDGVVTVASTHDSERLFEYRLFTQPSDIADAAGSVYYPVECSGILQTIAQTPGRYAMVGLPCMLQALQQARLVDARLADRLVYHVGLVCGQNLSALATQWFCHQAGLHEPAVYVDFRNKADAPSAQRFAMVARDAAGHEAHWRQENGYAAAWHRGWFLLPGCSVCTDVFAECADLAFMDAWLPEYVGDARGTSLVLLREPRFEAWFEHNPDQDIQVRSVERQTLEDSQQHAIRNKLVASSERIRQRAREDRARKELPCPADGNTSRLWPIERRIVRLREPIRRSVRSASRDRPGDWDHAERKVAELERRVDSLKPLRAREQRCQLLLWGIQRRLSSIMAHATRESPENSAS